MTDDGEAARLPAENARLRARIEELESMANARLDDAAFLQSVLTAVPAFIVRVDSNLRIRYLNRYQPGWSFSSVSGRSVFDFIATDDHEKFREHVELARATGKLTSYATRGTGALGEEAHYVTYITPLHEADGTIGVCLAAIDVTEYKRQGDALRDAEAQLQLALEATGLGLWSWDVSSGEVLWDKRMCALHGRDQPLPAEDYAEVFVHPDDRARFEAVRGQATSDGSWTSEPYRMVRGDGAVRWLLSIGRSVKDERGKVVKVLGGQVDVTAQHMLEEQLRQSQKMEAVGSLTAGIAHNFNNMLTVILPTLELTTKLLPPDRVALLREATHAARRAAEMVQQLMTYAGQTDAHDRAVHGIDTLIEAAVSICRRAFDQRIALETSYEGPPSAVSCNAVQLEQVLVNLLVNARDAVIDAGHTEGRVLVRSRTANVLRDDGRTQRCALIEVIDDGIGMTDAVRARVFEPFFTTKTGGRGTGLGLATSFAIVRDLDGTLSCDSAPAVGTTFTILLPVSNDPITQPKPGAALTMPAGHRVLIVDDEMAVRMTLQYVLGDAGLTVLSAESGKLALDLLRARGHEIDVVLLDRSMPGGPGESFVPSIRELAPHARIIFLSGGTVDSALAAMVDAVVPKPVTGPALLDAIHQLFEPNATRH